MTNPLQNKRSVLIFVAVFALLGGAYLFISRAATPSFSVQPEDGTKTGGAASFNDDPNASGGYIKFGSAAPPPSGSDFHTCFPDAFCNPSNQVVVMNGANIRYVGENTQVTSAAQMQKIKDKGFNSVRLVLDWEVYQPSAGTGGFSTTAFNNLRTAVTNAKNAGIYVILDPIHFGGTGTSCGSSALCIPPWARVNSGSTYQGSARSVKTNAKDYIEKIATDYANEPTVVAIDLVNEPKPEPFGDDELISMYNTLIGWARGKDSDKILMIESNSGNKIYATNVMSQLSTTQNIIFSFHHYFGGARNSSGTIISGCTVGGYSSSGWPCGNFTYENQNGYVFINRDDLKAQITANQTMLSSAGKNLPIWIGEWGIIEGGANAVQWRKDMTSVFNEMKIGRAYWQYANSANDPPNENMSMTAEGSSTPGAFKSWVSDIL
jgi:aryl-phospho-beta-D-glucosidase BglC (GH1 family)